MTKQFITSDNAHRFAKLQGSRAYRDREIAIMWDELSQKQKNAVKNIDVDVTVHTSDPSSVPDKWSDSIEKLGEELSHINLIKMIIANPSRADVYDLLVEEDPSEPLMLWWLGHTFSDMDYSQRLADICHYGLFRTDTDYLWATVAFGVDAGVGKFSWPEGTGDSIEDEELFEEVLESTDYPEKELRLVWDDVKGEAEGWIGRDDSKDTNEVDDGSGDNGSGRSLLDL